MKVLFLLLRLEPGGASMYVLRLAGEMRRRGHDASILSLLPCERADALLAGTGIPHRCLELASALDRRAVGAIAAELQRDRPDVLHTNHPIDALWGNLAARRAGVASVTTFHGTIDQFGLQKSGRLARWLSQTRYLWVERVAGRCARRSIAISEFVRRELVERRICPPSRVEVIPHGIDLAAFSPRPAEGEPGAPLVVGCVARISPEKGIRTFIEAIPHVRERFPQVEFHLIGEAKTEPEQRYLETCLAPLRAGGHAESLKLLGQQSDVAACMARMDLVAVPSLSEGFGLVVVEAMAMAKPVVASRVGGIPEIVIPGDTGLLAPPGDAKALAGALVRLLEDANLRERMGLAGRRRAEAHFSQERMVEETLRLYQEVARA